MRWPSGRNAHNPLGTRHVRDERSLSPSKAAEGAAMSEPARSNVDEMKALLQVA